MFKSVTRRQRGSITTHPVEHDHVRPERNPKRRAQKIFQALHAVCSLLCAAIPRVPGRVLDQRHLSHVRGDRRGVANAN